MIIWENVIAVIIVIALLFLFYVGGYIAGWSKAHQEIRNILSGKSNGGADE